MRCRIRRRPELLLAATLALAAGACHGPEDGSGASDAPSPGGPPAPHYADELARIDAEVARHSAAAGAARASWPAHEQLARTLLEKAALTGAFEDYAGAVAAITTAKGLAGADAVCATAACVALAVHRLAAAGAALKRCERLAVADADRGTELAALAAELAFQQGRYDAALRGARDVLERREMPRDLARLALIHEATGSPAEALALLDRAERADHADTPALRAWLAVRRGLVALHRGRWEEALAHYLAAQKRLAGWWLVDEHIAEVRALLGQAAAAATIYEGLLATQPRPEIMDAYARLLQAAGRPADADPWIRRAREAHRQRGQALPEAADGHALAHVLAFAPHAPATLALARRNAARQPNGEARLALARALLAANRPGEALAVVQAARATSWNTAELQAVTHAVLQRARLADRARAAAAQAGAMNPRWQAQYGTP